MIIGRSLQTVTVTRFQKPDDLTLLVNEAVLNLPHCRQQWLLLPSAVAIDVV